MSADVCYCSVGFHTECINPVELEEGVLSCCCWREEFVIGLVDRVETETSGPKSRYREGDTLKDVTSTGRKRAAELFPVTDGMLCEWAGLLYAGGGVAPIVGCAGNRLSAEKGKHAIHHGPDKSTLNNEAGNIHRICPTCHNRWHSINDQFYGKRPENGEPFIPLGGVFHAHDAETEATDEDIEYAEKYWATPIKKREEMRK